MQPWNSAATIVEPLQGGGADPIGYLGSGSGDSAAERGDGEKAARPGRVMRLVPETGGCAAGGPRRARVTVPVQTGAAVGVATGATGGRERLRFPVADPRTAQGGLHDALRRGAAAAGVRLRPCAVRDMAFLERLFRLERRRELDAAGWSEGDVRQFCAEQFALQHRSYCASYPGAAFLLVLVAGQPIGRLYVDALGTELRLIDMLMLPQWRGRGIGRALVTAVQAHAATIGKPVALSVLRANASAAALYRSLGFATTAFDAFRLAMRWIPDSRTE